jgi:hypothetical protein
MTPRQLAILRGYGGWMLADILIDPDRGISHAKQSRYGRTSFRVEGEEFWMETTPHGIELSSWTTGAERRVCEVVRWSQIARFTRSLPASLVAELRSHREQLTRSTLARPVFPVRATAEEQQRWEHTVYAPWLARRRAITAALEAALDRALLTGHTEQPALFDVAGPRTQPAKTNPARSKDRRVATTGPEQDRLL